MLDTNPADVNVMLNCAHHRVYIILVTVQSENPGNKKILGS